MILNINFFPDSFEKINEECYEGETPIDLIYEYFYIEETENGVKWDESLAFPNSKTVVVGKNESLVSVMKIQLVPIVENVNYYPIYGVFIKKDDEIHLNVVSRKDADEAGKSLLDFINKFELQNSCN